MALTAAEKKKKMQEIKKKLADKRAKNKEKSPRAKKVEANRNKRKVAYQEKLAKKKTAVKGTMTGKQVDTTKGPNYKKTTASKKSTANKTSVVNKATTGQKSEKTGPNMSRGVPKRGSVVNGAKGKKAKISNTYNTGPAMLKSKEDKKKSALRRKAGQKTVKPKTRYRARATMTGFGR